jgi:hypothetical protein
MQLLLTETLLGRRFRLIQQYPKFVAITLCLIKYKQGLAYLKVLDKQSYYPNPKRYAGYKCRNPKPTHPGYS